MNPSLEILKVARELLAKDAEKEVERLYPLRMIWV